MAGIAGRGTRITAALAALFVLHVPFCALACLDEAPEASPAAIEHGGHPCHETAPDPSPADAPPSHADCDCERTATALTSQPVQVATILAHGFSAPTPVPYARPSRVHRTAAVRHTDLPPPDILLRKSTLLL